MDKPIGPIDQAFLDQQDALVAAVMRVVRCRDTAEDLVQETYLRVRQAARVRTIDQPRPFLFRTARNLALDRLRRQKHEAYQRLAAGGHAQPGTEQTWTHRQDLDRIDQALKRLPPACRQAFLMHRLEAATHRQIAAELGVSASMVDKHIRRAMTACRRALFEG